MTKLSSKVGEVLFEKLEPSDQDMLGLEIPLRDAKYQLPIYGIGS